MFFAYRDFTGDPDAVLDNLGFGRAHHRVLHFVNRKPGLRVATLLDILQITKQSLSRVLKQLIDRGYIEQRPGDQDRRERHLYPTKKGEALSLALVAPQLARVRCALEALAPGERSAVSVFLHAMRNDPDLHVQSGAHSGASPNTSVPDRADACGDLEHANGDEPARGKDR